MATREYSCKEHGYFTVVRPASFPTIEKCLSCNTVADRVYTVAPQFGIKGCTPMQPTIHTGEAEYEGWQREKWSEYSEKLHPDNAGKTTKLDVKSITGYDSPDPLPSALLD